MCFNGRVYPERANVNITIPGPLTVSVPEIGLRFKATVSVGASQISALVETEEGDQDLLTLRNYLGDIVSAMTDALGYLSGCGYEIELTSVTFPDGRHEVFGVGIPILEEGKGDRPLTFRELFRLITSGRPSSFFLHRGFSDLRHAIRSSGNTAFFCFRAIEDMRRSFWKPEDGRHRRPSWERMAAALRIGRGYIVPVKQWRDLQAHGEPKHMTDRERAEILQRTWRVMDRFCAYLFRGEKPLPEEEFVFLG